MAFMPTSRRNFTPRSQEETIAMCKHHRRLIAETVQAIGIREVARRAGLTPMLVSRFVNNDGADRAMDFYRIAAAIGYNVELR